MSELSALEPVLFSTEYLKTRNVSIYSIAKKLGVAPSSIYELAWGNRVPSLVRAREVAAILSLPLDDLLFIKELAATPEEEGTKDKELSV